MHPFMAEFYGSAREVWDIQLPGIREMVIDRPAKHQEAKADIVVDRQLMNDRQGFVHNQPPNSRSAKFAMNAA